MNLPVQHLPIRQLIISGVLVLVVANLIFLDIRTATNTIQQPLPVQPRVAQNPIPLANQVQSPITPPENPCATCPAQINQMMGYIQKMQADLSITPKPTKILTPTPTPTPLSSSLYVKEYYVPFGSGSGQSADWTDVPGLQTSVNTSLYPAIKQVTFEVSAHTPTGNEVVYARLYNVTDNAPVVNSDITWAGGGEQVLVSSPSAFPAGNKIYKVQMKTQLQYLSYIDSAKVHIVLY